MYKHNIVDPVVCLAHRARTPLLPPRREHTPAACLLCLVAVQMAAFLHPLRVSTVRKVSCLNDMFALHFA